MKTKPFARRVIALVAVIGLAACQAANASPPPDPALIALDSGQKLLQKEFVQDNTGQPVAAVIAVTEKIVDAVAYAPKELDTSPQPDIITAALVVTPAANIDAVAYAPKELDTSPPIGGQLAIISGTLGIDANLDTGQPTAGYAGYQVQAPSA